MNLKLIRKDFTEESTIGDLYVNGAYFCKVLEDKVREVKIKSITAIPKGKYEVILSYSNRFKEVMPLLLNVMGFDGVRIHWGNYSKDSDGCLLVGSTKAVNFIGNSKATYAKLMAVLKKVSKTEKIFIEIC